MATRRQARKEVALSVRVFGTDANGRPFSDCVSTINVSLEGAMIEGLNRPIRAGEVIGLTYGKNKARFRVQWVGQPGTVQQGRMGIQNVVPGNCVWDVALPETGTDEHGRTLTSPRPQPRMKCSTSAELRPLGEAPVWSKIGDISEGGCFVEMMIPLKPGTRLKISLWLKNDKVAAEGVVANSRPGFGVGIRFTEMAPPDVERLRQFVRSLVSIPAHSLSQL
jgi:PilZ domain-containing protein